MDPSVQLGPLTTKKRLNEVEELVEKTKKEGAKVLYRMAHVHTASYPYKGGFADKDRAQIERVHHI